MPSKLWAVRRYLHTTYTEALRASGVKVYDGPRPRADAPKAFLIVGSNKGVDESGTAQRATQTPSPMGSGEWRQESGEIDCCVVTWTGDSDMEPLRVRAEAIVNICEDALRSDPTLGGLIEPGNEPTELTSIEVAEARTDKGPFVETVFTVSYGTLLTS